MYYYLNESLNEKIVGHYFQSQNVQNYAMDDPRYLTNNYFKKLDFEPITPVAILHKKAKFTDLISNVNAGGNYHLLMSDKLKNILDKSRTEGLQFFKSRIIKGDITYDNYWSLNMYETNNNFIDFQKTTIRYRKYDPNKLNDIEFTSVADCEAYEKWLATKNMFDEVVLHQVNIKDGTTQDFFMIKFSVKFVVSEKLKREIEAAGCTGIEFQPTELSFSEWTAPGGEREKIYGKM